MKINIGIFWTLIFMILGCGNSSSNYPDKDSKITFGFFEIAVDTIRDSSKIIMQDDFEGDTLFADDKYVVRKTCSGEWGGSIWFRNKISNIEYSCEATCPIIVYKLNGKYYITASLAHLSGSSKILEISNPESLEVFKLPPQRIRDGKKYRIVGDDESNSSKGVRVLVDTHGVLAVTSFIYQNGLFHIISDYNGTYVSEIKNNKYFIIDTITNESIWPYLRKAIETEPEHVLVPIRSRNKDSEGYIEIINNKINLWWKKL